MSLCSRDRGDLCVDASFLLTCRLFPLRAPPAKNLQMFEVEALLKNLQLSYNPQISKCREDIGRILKRSDDSAGLPWEGLNLIHYDVTSNWAGLVMKSRPTTVHCTVHMKRVRLESDDLVGVCHEFVEVVHPRERAGS